MGPQALNRYSYTGNNPINFTDPSGHDAISTCGGNTACMSYVNQNPIYIDTNIYTDSFDTELGLTFTHDEGVSWSLDEKVKARRSARDVAGSLGAIAGSGISDADAFTTAFSSGLEYHKSNQTCAQYWNDPQLTCWGTTVGNTINVFTNANSAHASYTHFLVHEMGHAFDNAVGGALTAGYKERIENIYNGQGWTAMPTGNDGYGCARTLCPWIQGYHSLDVTGDDMEQTADMFLGWVYNGWGNDSRRKNWMGLWMPYLMNHTTPPYSKQYGCDENTGDGCY